MWCRFHLREPNEREHKATRLPYELQTPTSDTHQNTGYCRPRIALLKTDATSTHTQLPASRGSTRYIQPRLTILGLPCPRNQQSDRRNATQRDAIRTIQEKPSDCSSRRLAATPAATQALSSAHAASGTGVAPPQVLGTCRCRCSCRAIKRTNRRYERCAATP